MAETNITLTEQALRNISAMQQRVIQADLKYGDSPEVTKMLWSLNHALIGMLRLGGRITAEDELSLYCMNPHIHYGVNFSAERVNGERDPLLGSWSLNS